MTRVLFADEDHGRDPLTGRPPGDPVVAVRAGLAVALALVAARLGARVAWELARGTWRLVWVDVQIALAVALPIGAALAVVVWRDRPGRHLLTRAIEAATLAFAVWAATESWAFFNLSRNVPESAWWWVTIDLHARAPRIGGLAVGLILAASQPGRHALGVTLFVPAELGESLGAVLFWPDTFNPWISFVHGALAMLVAPLAERALVRASTWAG